jgi:hypothetical protein
MSAIEAFYKDAETVDHRTRALALNATALPTDKTYANQLKAAALLEGVFQEHPQHPGVAHYLIHSYDYPPIAPRGLDAARRYASIAPSVPHALHMPSHIFTRLGLWQESLDTNRASAESAREELLTTHQQGAGSYNALHALDYIMSMANTTSMLRRRTHAKAYDRFECQDDRASVQNFSDAPGKPGRPLDKGAGMATIMAYLHYKGMVEQWTPLYSMARRMHVSSCWMDVPRLG